MLITIITFILILGLLVFVHELGHFVTARKMGVKVEEFGFGLPPRIIGIKRGETVYSLNWLPLGGFCKIKGEEGSNREDEDSFSHKKIWQRAVILASGVGMNFLLAAFLLAGGYLVGLPQVLDGLPAGAKIRDPKIQIISVIKNSPAQKAGLKIGDTILSIDNQKFSEIKKLQEYVRQRSNQVLVIKIKRGEEIFEKEIIPRENVILKNEVEQSDEKIPSNNNTTNGKSVFGPLRAKGVMGVGLVKTAIVSYPWYKALWYGGVTTISLMAQIILAFYLLIKNLILGQGITVDFAGPVGIAAMTGQVVQLGFIYVLQFAALLSINLGIINFFPFPALDGGRFIALGVEKLRGKPNNPKIENLIHNLGFALLMILIILITFRDLRQLGIKLWQKFF
jgi:regulator of sigma E protease